MLLPLRYPEGWQEIETAVDAADLQHQLDELCTATSRRLPGFASEARRRWRAVIEEVSSCAIPEGELAEMTQAEILETALTTVTETLAGAGWHEDGISVAIPDINTGEAKLFDIRKPADPEVLFNI